MARKGHDPILHFECDSCGTHLGVDESLAGLKAPCPKCGQLILAPVAPEPSERIPSAAVTRGVGAGAGNQAGFRSYDSTGQAVRSEGSEKVVRKVYPNSGRMANEDEKENFKVVVKIVIATALVILVVALVGWYLQRP